MGSLFFGNNWKGWAMRLDKYLQVTGLIKRRALANEACKLGLVQINGAVAKATKQVEVGDVIAIALARREMEVRVLKALMSNSLKKTLRPEYFEVLRDEIKALDDGFWDDIEDEADDENEE